MYRIDLNCDMGEGMEYDGEIMPCISSANIACGYHAGSPEVMQRTVETAMLYGVAIGAHPGFGDKANFGRTEIKMSSTQLYDLVARQIDGLQAVCRSAGAKLYHVKPHGALYNMAARDMAMSRTIAAAVKEADEGLVLFGLSGSCLIDAAAEAGLRTASEVFADRTYQPDGSLTPRTLPGAMIENEDKAITQVLGMIRQGTVLSLSGEVVPIRAETVCIHGDGAHAVDFAQRIRHTRKNNGIAIKTP
jgi:5-oxoprolinase (ATP-hydrolysing) subunit A